MERLPEIRNSIPLAFDSSDFVNNVKKYIPIELTIEVILLNRSTKDCVLMHEFRAINNQEELDTLLKNAYPMVRIGLFRSQYVLNYFEELLEDNVDAIKNKIVKPFNEKILDIIKKDYDIDKDLSNIGYNEVKTLEDVPTFIRKTDKIIINIFESLNKHKKEYMYLLISAYEDIGFLLNRAYVAKYLRDPDDFMEYDDGSLVGIFRSDFAITYIYPDGFEEYK